MAHLKELPLLKAGDWVKRGQLIGHIGNTGASTGAHLHIELLKKKPWSWYFYPKGRSKYFVKNMYLDPTFLFKDGIPCDFTYKGYGFLQWNARGRVFHPGLDANSPNDFGKPLYSPVNGRVQFAEGISSWRRIGKKIIPGYWNRGWGNHIFIEIDESNPGV